MSYNGSGTFQINTSGQPVVAGTVISSTAFNALTADLATGLSTAITKDGQTTTTARIPFAAGINSSSATDSTSTATGSIITSGGVGVAKAVYVGTTLNVAGATTAASGSFTSLSDSGNLTFTGTGNRITGDFSNATLANRVAFQSSTTNGVSDVNVLPNGTSLVSAIRLNNNSDPTNAGICRLVVSDTVATLDSNRNGTGTYLPMTLNTGGSERVRVDTSGNVGIGTSSPSAKFQVDSSSATYSANIRARNSNFGSGVVGAASGILTVATDMNNIAFYTGSNLGVDGTSAPTNERMRIDSSGNLGIGATPTAKLTVLANADTYGQIFWNDTASNPFGLLIQYRNIDPNGGSNQFLDCYGGASTLRAQIRSNGGLANYSANNVNLSDRREKTNFAPAGDYLTKICAIPVQTFNYIDQNLEEDDGLTLGVVAQDVQAVAPELVLESNWAKVEEEPKMRLSIYQTDLQYALMKCIQEQQALIQSLTARITALETN